MLVSRFFAFFARNHGGLPTPSLRRYQSYADRTEARTSPSDLSAHNPRPASPGTVDCLLVSCLTYHSFFFVFSTRRSNSGCGSGEHKDGRRWRCRPVTHRFDTHTLWLDGWAVWNGRWELSRRPQTHGIGNEILHQKTQHAIRKRMITPHPALGPAIRRTNTLCICSGRYVGPWSVGGALVGEARGRVVRMKKFIR